MRTSFSMIGLPIASVGLLVASNVCAFTYQPTPLQMSYNNPLAQDVGKSVKTDSQGNIYLVSSELYTNIDNGKLIKYSPTGQTIWIKDFDPNNPRPKDKSISLKSKGISAVAVDKTDAIYVVGESFNGTSLDCLLKKFNANGDIVWQTRYNTPISGTSGFDNYCKDVTIDNAGDIIAGGSSLSFTGANAGDNFNQILKWNSAGQLIGKFNSQTNGLSACGRSNPCGMNIEKVTTDIDRNIYTLEYNSVMYGRRFAKYSPTFQILKATAEQNSTSNPELFEPFDIAVDSVGHVIAGGHQPVPNAYGGYDLYSKMIVMDSNLALQCEDKRKYYTPDPSVKEDSVFTSVVIAHNGKALLSGFENRGFLAMEYDAQCQPKWRDVSGAAVPIKTKVDYADSAFAGTLDGQNNLIITGAAMQGDLVNMKAVTLKYTLNAVSTSSDLVVSAAAAPTTAKTGKALTVSGKIKNQGTGATGDATTGISYAAVYVSTDNLITRQDTLLCRTPISTLAAGVEQAFSCTGTLPPNLLTGAYTIGVVADDGNVIAETNEGNNTLTGPFQYTALPDLVVSSLTFPASRMSGETLTVSGTFKNQGAGTTMQSYVGYVVMSPDSTVTTSDNWICTVPVGQVLPGATKDFSCTITLPTNNTIWYAGDYYIGAFVYDIEETDTTNNTLAKPFKLIAPPVPSDLVITDAYAPASVQRGQKLTVSGTVRNQGFGPTGTSPYTGLSWVGVYLSQDSVITSADTFICSYGNAGMNPGTNRPFTCTGTVPANIATGNYTVGVVADDGNYVAETNETNNIKTFGIVVTP